MEEREIFAETVMGILDDAKEKKLISKWSMEHDEEGVKLEASIASITNQCHTTWSEIEQSRLPANTARGAVGALLYPILRKKK